MVGVFYVRQTLLTFTCVSHIFLNFVCICVAQCSCIQIRNHYC